MNIDVKVVSIPNAIPADEAKRMAKQHEEQEMAKDINIIMGYLSSTPWEQIKDAAEKGETRTTITFGYASRNFCYTRKNYGFRWLSGEGKEIITNLFTSLGYRVTFDWYTDFVKVAIDWAD